MMKNAMEISIAKMAMEEKLGKDVVDKLLHLARVKIDSIKETTGVMNEFAICKLNMKLASTPESKLIWAIMIGE
jgi:hypothetical protein